VNGHAGERSATIRSPGTNLSKARGGADRRAERILTRSDLKAPLQLEHVIPVGLFQRTLAFESYASRSRHLGVPGGKSIAREVSVGFR